MHVKHSQVSKIQSHVVCEVVGWLVVFLTNQLRGYT